MHADLVEDILYSVMPSTFWEVCGMSVPTSSSLIHHSTSEKNTDPVELRQIKTADSKYEQFMQSVLKESVRILCPGGALYLYHLPQWAMRLGAFLHGKMSFRHWIAVSMKNGFVRGNHLYPAHYALLYFSKGVPRTFNRPKVQLQHAEVAVSL